MTAAPTSAKSTLAGHQFVVFGADWNRYPTPTQHLFSCFLKDSKVLWVETVGLRNPSLNLRDLRRSFQKVTDFFSRRREATPPDYPNLRITCPPTLPFTRLAIVRRFNRWQVCRTVRRVMHEMNFQQPTLVLTTPVQADFVGRLGEGVSLYYCLDHYALWAGMNAAHVERMEAQLLRRVDGVVVVSEYLAERMAHAGKPVRIITPGVNADHFHAAPSRTPSRPFEIVYFGMIDDRLDQELLALAAQALPDAIFRLIGAVVTPVERLRAIPNLVFAGRVAYADLPAAAASADAFILPFRMSNLSRSCSPVKLREYLACGRPVIATAMPAAIALREHIHVARNSGEFVDCLCRATQGLLSFDAPRVAAYVANESWESKALAFAEMIRTLPAQNKPLEGEAVPSRTLCCGSPQARPPLGETARARPSSQRRT